MVAKRLVTGKESLVYAHLCLAYFKGFQLDMHMCEGT